MPLTDRQIRADIAPCMYHPDRKVWTFVEGTSGPGIISYGLTSAGYDFRLAERIEIFDKRCTTIVDPKKFHGSILQPLEVFHERATYSGPATMSGRTIDQRYVVMPPFSYALGETVEWLEVPEDIIVTILTKSTYARAGLIVNATPIEPSWKGIITLEFANVSPLPIRLYVGEGIAQAIFWSLSERPEKTYADKPGKYQNQKGLTLPRA